MNDAINVIIDSYPIEKDINYVNDYTGILVFSPTACPLFIYDSKIRNYKKYACGSYIIENKGKTHKCKLRDDLYWSDGKKVVTEDYYNSFIKIITTRREIAFFLRNILNYKQFVQKKVDVEQLGIHISGNILEFELEKADYIFYKVLSKINFSPIRMDRNEKCHNQSAGPYYISGTSDDRFVLVKNKFHFNYSKTKKNDLTFLLSNSYYKDIERFGLKEIDATCNTSFPFNEIEKYQRNKNYHCSPNNIDILLVFTKKVPIELRRALLHLIDRREIAEKFKKAFIVSGDLTINYQKQTDNIQLDSLYNEKDALKYLEEFRSKYNQKQITIDIGYDSFYPNKEILLEISNSLNKYDVLVNVIEDNYYKPDISIYDAKLVLSFIPYFDDVSNYEIIGLFSLMSVLAEKGQILAEYLKLLNLYKTLKNKNEKENIINNLNRIVIDAVGVIPLFKMYNHYLMNSNLKNFSYGEDFYFDELFKECE